MVNTWGYSTVNFFAPMSRYGTPGSSPAEAAAQFKTMVKALHAAGIEVILDVVYNHTAEVRPAPCSPPARARRWPTPLLITPCFFAL